MVSCLGVSQRTSVCGRMLHVRHCRCLHPTPCRTYRLSQNIKPLIWVECQVDKHSRSRTEYLVKARSQFKERSTATSVEIMLPLPPDAISPTVRTSQVGGEAAHRRAGEGGTCSRARLQLQGAGSTAAALP